MTRHIKKSVVSNSEEETLALGKKIGRALMAGDMVFLSGDLGSGKTTITRGICRGIGVDESIPIRSPSFTMIHEYDAPGLHVRHADLYRAEGDEELNSLGIFDPAYTGVTIIEWADRLADDTLTPLLWIRMKDISDSVREISLTAPLELFKKAGILP